MALRRGGLVSIIIGCHRVPFECYGSVHDIGCSYSFFFIFETRWGKPRLHNYEALWKNTTTLPHARLTWRAVLSTLLPLSLGHSFAYENFSDERSTLSNATGNVYYGLIPPLMRDYIAVNNYIPPTVIATVLYFWLPRRETVFLYRFPVFNKNPDSILCLLPIRQPLYLTSWRPTVYLQFTRV